MGSLFSGPEKQPEPMTDVVIEHQPVPESDYLIRCHLDLPPFNKMPYDEAIVAIRKHCGYI